MIDDCLYKIEKEIPRTREDYTVQELMLYRYQELEYKGDVQRVNAVHKLRSDPYKMGVQTILRSNQSCARRDIYLHPKYLH